MQDLQYLAYLKHLLQLHLLIHQDHQAQSGVDLKKEGEIIRRRMEELAKVMLSRDLVREKSEYHGDRMYA